MATSDLQRLLIRIEGDACKLRSAFAYARRRGGGFAAAFEN